MLDNPRFAKRLFSAIAGVAALTGATSCADDSIMPESQGVETVTTLTVNIPEGFRSRADRLYGDGATNELFLQYAIFREDGALVQSSDMTDVAAPTQTEAGQWELKVKMMTGHDYTVFFWADQFGKDFGAECPYTVDVATTHLSVDYAKALKPEYLITDRCDAYTLTQTFKPGEVSSFTMKRPFCQVNIGSAEEAVTDASSKYHDRSITAVWDDATLCTGINLSDMSDAEIKTYTVSGSANPIPNAPSISIADFDAATDFDFPGVDGAKYMYMAYMLVPGDAATLDFFIEDAEKERAFSVPVTGKAKANTRIIVSPGDDGFFGPPMVDTDLFIQYDPDFDGHNVILWPETPIEPKLGRFAGSYIANSYESDWYINVNGERIKVEVDPTTKTFDMMIPIPEGSVENFFIDPYYVKTIEVFPFTSAITSTASMFNYSSIESLECSDWDTSNVTDMSGMFQHCDRLTTLDVSNWDTGNVTDMSDMFSNCGWEFTTLDVSNWDTSNVYSMTGMFRECLKLAYLDVSNWDTGNVTDMSDMFFGCSKLTELSVTSWDTGNVTTMSKTFQRCTNLASLDVSNWSTGNVTDMSGMFSSCSTLSELNVSNWETGNVTNMHVMFSYCSNITNLDVSKWDTSSVTSMESMFNNCSNIVSLDVSKWDTGNVYSMSGMFGGCSKLVYLDVSNWDTGSVGQMTGMFAECSALTTIDVSNWDTSNVTWMGNMFKECRLLTTLDVSHWNTSNVTSMNDMFYACYSLTNLDPSNWDTSKVDDMQNMFLSCRNLTTLNLDGWDISSVRYLNNMFKDCRNLTSIEVASWNTSNVGGMSYIFSGCSNLVSIDCANWDTNKAYSISGMFKDCTKLETVNIPFFSGQSITQSFNKEYLFYGCSSLHIINTNATFQSWCHENQDLIKLPEAMREGGSGTWHIAA